MARVLLIILFSFTTILAGAQRYTPVVSFGVIEPGRKTPITISELLRNPQMIANEGYRIMSYEVMVKSNTSDMFSSPYLVVGPRITQEAIDAINAYRKRGGTVYFDKIVVVGTDKRPRVCNSLVYKFTN